MKRCCGRAPSGCNIRWLTIHLMRGTCKALPSYGAWLKATTVTADFWNLLVAAALTCHVCTHPRYLRESVGRNKTTTHSYLPCAPCRDGFSFPLIINVFAPESGKYKQKKNPANRPWCTTHLYQRMFGFKHQVSDTDIQLTAITVGGK